MTQEQYLIKILVIDDEEEFRSLLEDWIEDEGAKPTSFSNGNEGVDDYFSKERTDDAYDAVITDMNMLDGSGTYTVYRIKESPKQIPVIAVTALTGEQVDDFFSNQPDTRPDVILTKPIQKVDITNLVKEIGNYKLNPENPLTFSQAPPPYQL